MKMADVQTVEWKKVGRLRLSRVRKDGDCLLWTGHTNSKGYSTVQVLGVRVYIHRLAYMVHVGPIPDGLTIDHLCRNKRCVNPDHLEAVTNKVNILRGLGVTAQNKRKTHCKRGHPLEGVNLRLLPGGGRACRTCLRVYAHRRWAMKRKSHKA